MGFRRLIGLVALVSLLSGAAEAQNRFAFVVGNDAYANVPQLQKAVNDARAVARGMQQLGFKVTFGENLPQREFVQKFSSFESQVQPGDIVFLYYSGHGVEIDGANYLIPIDVPKVDPAQQSLLKDLSISSENLILRLKEHGARTEVVVLDACRDNPFRASNGRSVGGARGLAGVDPPGGVFMIYSAGVGEQALDRLSDSDTNPNSVFTRSFLPLLENPANSLIDVAKQTRSAVKSLAATIGQTQSPAYYDEIDGEVYLANAAASLAPMTPRSAPPARDAIPPPQPAPAPPPVIAALPPEIPPAPPRPIERSTSPAVSGGFIFPESDRVRLTRSQVSGLSAAQLRIARNEIYARRGRYFKDQSLADYFGHFNWYHPYAWEVPLNAVEKANVELIASAER